MHGLHFWCGRVLATEVNTDDGRAMKLFIVLVGVKGDWVYLRIWFAKWGLALGYVCVCTESCSHACGLRACGHWGKAHALLSGFTSTRKCHFCSSREPWQLDELGIHVAVLYFISLHECLCWLAQVSMFKSTHGVWSKDWYDMKLTAAWRQERPWTSAVRDPPPSLHSLPGGHPCESPPDQMHTWHHGVGREFCSSSIVPCLINIVSFMAVLLLFTCTHGRHTCMQEYPGTSSMQVACFCWSQKWRSACCSLWFISQLVRGWEKKTTLKKFELKTFKMSSCFGFKIMHVCARMHDHVFIWRYIYVASQSTSLWLVLGLLNLGFNVGQGGVERPMTPLCYVSGCCQLWRRNSEMAMILSSKTRMNGSKQSMLLSPFCFAML